MSLSCAVSEILSLIYQNSTRPHDPEYSPFGGNLSHAVVLTTINWHAKFEVQNFT